MLVTVDVSTVCCVVFTNFFIFCVLTAARVDTGVYARSSTEIFILAQSGR